jgi:hypothetical protein
MDSYSAERPNNLAQRSAAHARDVVRQQDVTISILLKTSFATYSH